MQTTEIFVEQLIIGALTLLAIVLLAAPTAITMVTDPGVATGALFLGSAYLTGIIADRFFDTLLEDAEQHQRLVTAVRTHEKLGKGEAKPDLAAAPEKDPFPEDQLRVALLRDEHLAPYGNYLRSRIRLMRALAVLFPAIAIGLALVSSYEDQRGHYRALAFVVLAFYGGLFLLTVLRVSKLPRTSELTDIKEYLAYRSKVGASKGYTVPQMESLAALKSRAVIAAILLTVTSVLFLWRTGPVQLVLFPLLGLVGALFAGWVWWRITRTFHHLLLTISKIDERR